MTWQSHLPWNAAVHSTSMLAAPKTPLMVVHHQSPMENTAEAYLVRDAIDSNYHSIRVLILCVCHCEKRKNDLSQGSEHTNYPISRSPHHHIRWEPLETSWINLNYKSNGLISVTKRPWQMATPCIGIEYELSTGMNCSTEFERLDYIFKPRFELKFSNGDIHIQISYRDFNINLPVLDKPVYWYQTRMLHTADYRYVRLLSAWNVN